MVSCGHGENLGALWSAERLSHVCDSVVNLMCIFGLSPGLLALVCLLKDTEPVNHTL